MQTAAMEKKLLSETIYKTDKATLYLGDTFETLFCLESESVDVIFADPPYFLSSDGITCKSGKMESVNKAEWDASLSIQEKNEYNVAWIMQCYRILKPNGTIWISGTFHNIYSCGVALEECGFKILNNITWQKSNPPPNLACKCFTHSTETILWAKKKNGKPVFNYKKMKETNSGKQMKDVWTGPLTPQKEKKNGKHPTQKPLYILDRIIESSTSDGMIVLDPFCGSGTTGVAAISHGCYFIGIDNNESYLEITKKRIEEV